MKKIFLTSAIMLSTLFSFASNGENEILESNLYNSIENVSNTDENTFFAETNTYRIMIRVYACGGEYSTDWFQEIAQTTPCITIDQLNQLIASYTTFYGILHPDVCNYYVFEELISNCN